MTRIGVGYAGRGLAAFAFCCVVACGGNIQNSGGSGPGGGSGPSGGSGPGGGSGPSGGSTSCASSLVNSDLAPPCTSDADCASPGARCAAVVPGGYRTCVSEAGVATTCSKSLDATMDTDADLCGCNGAVCAQGKACYQTETALCGDRSQSIQNECLTPCTAGSCASGEACIAAVRAHVVHEPKGTYPGVGNPIPQCGSASCRTDADCGGCSRCAPYFSVLGGIPSDCGVAFKGLRCTCRTDSDCKHGFTCTDVGTGTHYCLGPGFY